MTSSFFFHYRPNKQITKNKKNIIYFKLTYKHLKNKQTKNLRV